MDYFFLSHGTQLVGTTENANCYSETKGSFNSLKNYVTFVELNFKQNITSFVIFDSFSSRKKNNKE